MPQLTLFSTPKPFSGHVGMIQRNAVESWARLAPQVETLLLGAEQGCAEAAAGVGSRHISEIACNEYGTPLISDIFRRGTENGRADALCYVNADIVFVSGLLEALSAVRARFPRFVMVGRRWDLDVTAPLTFDSGWQPHLIERAQRDGALSAPSAIDYILFSRGALPPIPDFAVGRPAWDNWLIYRLVTGGVPLIDATDTIFAVHQNHDYRHVPARVGNAWEGPEAERNRRLAGVGNGFVPRHYTTEIARYRLVGGRVATGLERPRLHRRARAWISRNPEFWLRRLDRKAPWLFAPARWLRTAVRGRSRSGDRIAGRSS